ncbi:AAA family ATPase [Vibrio parahaemolyticus]|nr:AAA family ATPase [Vibrio parahaemolyticus]
MHYLIDLRTLFVSIQGEKISPKAGSEAKEMLKRFGVTNFSSFKDEQVFDMTAGTTKVLADHAIDFGDVKILKSAVIYGANASGKSNLVKAIDFSKNVVLKDLNNIETYKKHFRLCNESYKKDSSFEFEIEIGGRFFSYGFSILLKEKIIKEEWLVEIGKGRPNIIFQRTGSEIVLGSKISLDTSSKTRLEIYSDDMKNQEGRLFLTEVAEKKLDLEIISPINDIFNWFKSKLIIIYPDSKFGGVQLINKNFAEQLSHYLKSFDTGVVSVSSIEEDFEEAFKGLPEELKIGVEEGVSKAKSGKVMVQGIGAEPQFLTVYKNKNDELKVKKLGLVHGKEIKETFETI